MSHAWPQVYDPFGQAWLSTLVAALPVAVLLGALALWRRPAHQAAMLALALAGVVAVLVNGMPVQLALVAGAYGAAYGLFPIGWIVLNLIFLYRLTVRTGRFATLRGSLVGLTPDARVQVLLVAFAFGAFFEGAAGFGTPVAITAALLVALGFAPLSAATISLVANTAPVAYGALGTPIIALAGVTGLGLHPLSAMVGRQLPLFSLLVPFVAVASFSGWRGMLGVWPAALVAGVAFAVPQALVANLHGPWLVDVVAAAVSIGAVVALLGVWRPTDAWRPDPARYAALDTESPRVTRAAAWSAWLPWVLLSAVVFVWGVPAFKSAVDGVTALKLEVPLLHLGVQRMPPVVEPGAAPEPAIFLFNWASATGTGILVAAIAAGALMGLSARELVAEWIATLRRVRRSLLTISAMLALGFLTRYAGTDATMGLALARTGVLYPFFGTLLGWLGVALTGSDTASNVLFGNLQTITARQVGVSPVLMAAANSSGGVMGKMIDAQSIVVAGAATNLDGREGEILRSVFWTSVALAALVGLLVLLQAYVPPFSHLTIGAG